MLLATKKSLLTFIIGLHFGVALAYLILKTDVIGRVFSPGYSSLEKEFVYRRTDEVARRMKEKVRVLCWVMTGPHNHEDKVAWLFIDNISESTNINFSPNRLVM